MEATNVAIAAVLDRVIADKERHAAFGWLYLASRAPLWTEKQRLCVAEELTAHVWDTELKGYHWPWLGPGDAVAEAGAGASVRGAGPGGGGRACEECVLFTIVRDGLA